ncbi:MAG: hypothetical protein JNK64_25335 [Myxococcales bacterium]|nr:hypothetical protein [Myxococcales bacterium]
MARSIVSAALPLLVLAGACVDNNADSGLVILRNVAPELGCNVDPGSSSVRTSGIIEDDAVTGYVFTPVVRNDLVTVEGENITAKSIFVSGARVTIDFYDPDLFTAAEQTTFDTDGLTKFVVPSSGAIDPDGGLQTFHLEIVPTELIAKIAPKLAAMTTDATPSTVLDVRVQFFGTRAGDDVSSNTFRYPVTVCHGCLTNVLGACDMLPDGEPRAGGACSPDQDGVIDCCLAADSSLVCPAIAPTPTT